MRYCCPRIFEDLQAPPTHGLAPADIAAMEAAKAAGAYTVILGGTERVLPGRYVQGLLESIVQQRGGEGAPTADDSSTLRNNIQTMVDAMFGGGNDDVTARRGPDQCHDITLYPELGIAGGACEGYGLLLDISDPANPVRIDAVADSNFAYWHSATFSNSGDKVIFTDEWEVVVDLSVETLIQWNGEQNAIFTIEDGKMEFKEYYKMPAPQTVNENRGS